MISFPNQNIVRINKQKYQRGFLQIGIDEWQEASKVLTPSAFKIYLYLASNMNGFELALSKQDIKNELGISFTRFYEAITLLKKHHYLCEDRKNHLQFFMTPNQEYADRKAIQNWESPKPDSDIPDLESSVPQLEQNSPISNIEIDKKDKIDKKDNTEDLFFEKWTLAEELEGILFNRDIDDESWKTISEIIDVDEYNRKEKEFSTAYRGDFEMFHYETINYVLGLINNLNCNQLDTIVCIVNEYFEE